ncbi:MAG: hypothetical protein IK088_01270 [Lachnospiraceae bacterium]|nr:hypothetical protein [Lachnospiraceae bacterium]
MSNIVYATFQEGKGTTVYTKKQYQHNRGVKLRISGIALPEKYQVHFSNDEIRGVASALWVSGSDISIPDGYFETGDYIYVWIYFAEDGKTLKGASEYHVIIPVEKRPAILQVSSDGGGLVINAELDQDDHTLIFH